MLISCLNTVSYNYIRSAVFESSYSRAYASVMDTRKKLAALMRRNMHNANRLSELCNVSQPTISRFLNGSHKEPRRETMERICEVYGLTYADFLTLEIDDEYTNIKSIAKKNEAAAFYDVPQLAAIASMGEGSSLDYDAGLVIKTMPLAREWLDITLHAQPENLRFITGAGDSMSPTFSNGDILLVDVSKRHPDIDGVYVISAHNRLFVKRLRQRLNGKFEVSSDNPTVKTVDELDGTSQIEIHGRVIWAWNGRKL